MGIFKTLERSLVLDCHRSQKHVGIAIFWLPTRKCSAKADMLSWTRCTSYLAELPSLHWSTVVKHLLPNSRRHSACSTLTYSKLIIHFLIFQGTPRPKEISKIFSKLIIKYMLTWLIIFKITGFILYIIRFYQLVFLMAGSFIKQCMPGFLSLLGGQVEERTIM